LERRIGSARIGRFKALADFDWGWPKQCDRGAVEGLMALDFIKEGANVVLRGPNGVGKSMVARNVAHQALVKGHTVRFTTAGELLGDLAALDSDAALRRRIRHYAAPDLLVIDEIGYLSYSNRHADLLFELVNRRYESKSTMVTTNKAFGEWNTVFPNAACVVSLIDRLVHHAELIDIDGDALPPKSSLALTGGCRTVGLIGDLRSGCKRLAAAGAIFGGHRVSPYENLYGTRWPTLVAYCLVQRCWRLGMA